MKDRQLEKIFQNRDIAKKIRKRMRQNNVMIIYCPSMSGKTYFVNNYSGDDILDGDTLLKWPKVPKWWEKKDLVRKVEYDQANTLIELSYQKPTIILLQPTGRCRVLTSMGVFISEGKFERLRDSRKRDNIGKKFPQGVVENYKDYMWDVYTYCRDNELPYFAPSYIERINFKRLFHWKRFESKIRYAIAPKGSGKSYYCDRFPDLFVDSDWLSIERKFSKSNEIFKVEKKLGYKNRKLIFNRILLASEVMDDSFDYIGGIVLPESHYKRVYYERENPMKIFHDNINRLKDMNLKPIKSHIDMEHFLFSLVEHYYYKEIPKVNKQMQSILGLIRDRNITTVKFRKLADYLIRKILEIVINELGFTDVVRYSKGGKLYKELTLTNPVRIVPVARSGFAMLDIFTDYLKLVETDYHVLPIYAKRDEETLVAEVTPLDISVSKMKFDVIILEPMIGTGGTLLQVYREIKRVSPNSRIIIASLIASKDGLDFLRSKDIYPIVLQTDEYLVKGFVEPGLGDFGDRYFNDSS
jgi:uracil phosphoribosyltransferase